LSKLEKVFRWQKTKKSLFNFLLNNWKEFQWQEKKRPDKKCSLLYFKSVARYTIWKWKKNFFVHFTFTTTSDTWQFQKAAFTKQKYPFYNQKHFCALTFSALGIQFKAFDYELFSQSITQRKWNITTGSKIQIESNILDLEFNHTKSK